MKALLDYWNAARTTVEELADGQHHMLENVRLLSCGSFQSVTRRAAECQDGKSEAALLASEANGPTLFRDFLKHVLIIQVRLGT